MLSLILQEEINKLDSYAQIKEARKLLKRKEQFLDSQNIYRFYVGDTVSFKINNTILTGTITQVNRTTLRVSVPDTTNSTVPFNTIWKVPVSLLTKS